MINNLPEKILQKAGFDSMEEWPNCPVSDCQWKCCLWAGTDFCFYHAAICLGRDEMIRRWYLTHDYSIEPANWPKGI